MNYNLDLANGTYSISGQSGGDGNLIKSCLSNPIIYKSIKSLMPPTIAADGHVLTITDIDTRTEEFVILVDGIETAIVANVEDISATLYFYYSYDDNISDITTITVPAGATWREWVEATNFKFGNQRRVGITDTSLTCGDAAALYDNKTNGNVVGPDDVIIANASYYFISKSK